MVRGETLDVSARSDGANLHLEAGTEIQNVIGTAQDDTLTGNAHDNELSGHAGNDVLEGGDGHDALHGGEGDDTLHGGDGEDRLSGGAGRDTFIYRTAAEATGDVITDFTPGEDTIDLSALGSFVLSEDGPRAQALWTVQEGNDLRVLGDVNGTPEAPSINILLKNVSALDVGSVGITDVVRGETLDVSARPEGAKLHLEDWTGIQNAIGTNRDDRLVGTDRDNTLRGGDGHDRVYGEDWDDHLYGGSGNDHLEGGHGRDHLFGGADDDALQGGEDHDHLHGDDGDDFLQGGDGHDHLYGGSGMDTADYSDHSAPVGVVLREARETQLRVDGQVEDTLVNIENVTGGSGDDRLVGDNAANVLIGRSGDDRLYGRGGDDILTGGHGTDYLDGGAGTDTVDYSGRYGSIEVDLNGSRQVKVLIDGEEEDTLRNIENVIGGFFDDVFTGDDKANTFTGGEGYDTFIYHNAEETVGDVITDFTPGEDQIDLSALDPLPFSANGPRANSVWTEQDQNGNLKVLGDTDGNMATHEIDLTLAGVTSITGADLRLSMGVIGDVLDARGLTDPRDLNISEQSDIRVVRAGHVGHVIRGNDQSNVLIGGAGSDTFSGQTGADTFVVDATSLAQDVITDFSEEDGDILQIVSATPLTFTDTIPGAQSIWYKVGENGVTVYADTDGDATANASWVLRGITTLSAASVQTIAEEPTFDVQPVAPTGGSAPSPSSSTPSPRLDFSGSVSGVAVSLAGSSDEEPELPYDGSWEDIVRPSSNQSEVMGSPHSDWIVGNAEANVLIGSGDDDVIYGLGGADTLTGGEGEDRFVYQRAEEGGDTITDFTLGEDSIDLSVMAEECGALDWSEKAPTEYAAWHETSNTLHDGVTLYADTDGDAVADFQITLVGVTHVNKENIILDSFGW